MEHGQEYLMDLLWRIIVEQGDDVFCSDEWEEAVRLFAEHYGPEHERGQKALSWLG